MALSGRIIDLSPEEIEHVSYLDNLLLDTNGRIKLYPAAFYQNVPFRLLQAWCHKKARYGIPTVELIEWLQGRIGDRRAIEVGAGNGDLSFHLGITGTDSYVQTSGVTALLYQMTGQPPTRPREDILVMDAETAVKQLKPEVVIASWLTRKFIEGGDEDGVSQASVFGPVEEELLKNCREYIHIGNVNIHGTKTILTLPHEEHFFPWLVSRASAPDKNVIYVWTES